MCVMCAQIGASLLGLCMAWPEARQLDIWLEMALVRVVPGCSACCVYCTACRACCSAWYA